MSINRIPVNAIETLLHEVLAGYPDLVAVYLFGSTAQNKAHRQSDIDLAILFTANLPAEIRFRHRLLIGAHLETRLPVPIDLIDLNSAPLFLCFQVIKTGRILLEHDRTARCIFQMRTMSFYYDLKPYLDQQRTQTMQRIQEKGLGYGYRGHRNALAEARRLRQALAPVAARPAG